MPTIHQGLSAMDMTVAQDVNDSGPELAAENEVASVHSSKDENDDQEENDRLLDAMLGSPSSSFSYAPSVLDAEPNPEDKPMNPTDANLEPAPAEPILGDTHSPRVSGDATSFQEFETDLQPHVSDSGLITNNASQVADIDNGISEPNPSDALQELEPSGASPDLHQQFPGHEEATNAKRRRVQVDLGIPGMHLYRSPDEILGPLAPPQCSLTLNHNDHRWVSTWPKSITSEHWMDELAKRTFSRVFDRHLNWKDKLRVVHEHAWDKWALAANHDPRLKLREGQVEPVHGQIPDSVLEELAPKIAELPPRKKYG